VRVSMRRKSFTLVEIIAVIVILSLAIPTLLMMFTQANLNSITTESVSKASYYAEALMEEIRSKRFDENDNSPWSNSLGPDGGEVSRSDYDDVDDYNGLSDHGAHDQNGHLIAGLTSYSIDVSVVPQGFGPPSMTIAGLKIDVTVIDPGGERLTLTGYRTDY